MSKEISYLRKEYVRNGKQQINSFFKGTGTAVSRNSTLVFESGQPCYDLSTRKLYVGDGTTILASEGLNTNDGVFIASSGLF